MLAVDALVLQGWMIDYYLLSRKMIPTRTRRRLDLLDEDWILLRKLQCTERRKKKQRFEKQEKANAWCEIDWIVLDRDMKTAMARDVLNPSYMMIMSRQRDVGVFVTCTETRSGTSFPRNASCAATWHDQSTENVSAVFQIVGWWWAGWRFGRTTARHKIPLYFKFKINQGCTSMLTLTS